MLTAHPCKIFDFPPMMGGARDMLAPIVYINTHVTHCVNVSLACLGLQYLCEIITLKFN